LGRHTHNTTLPKSNTHTCTLHSKFHNFHFLQHYFPTLSLHPNRAQKKERENSLPWPLYALPMWESLPWTSTSLPPASPRSQFVFFSHKALTFILSFCYVLFCKAVIFILCLVMLCVLF